MGAVLHCQEQPDPVVQLLQDMAESFQAFLEGRVAAAPGEGLGGVRQLCEFVGVFVAEVDEIVEGLPGEGLQRLATQPLGRDAGVFEHAQGARVDASGAHAGAERGEMFAVGVPQDGLGDQERASLAIQTKSTRSRSVIFPFSGAGSLLRS